MGTVKTAESGLKLALAVGQFPRLGKKLHPCLRGDAAKVLLQRAAISSEDKVKQGDQRRLPLAFQPQPHFDPASDLVRQRLSFVKRQDDDICRGGVLGGDRAQLGQAQQVNEPQVLDDISLPVRIADQVVAEFLHPGARGKILKSCNYN